MYKGSVWILGIVGIAASVAFAQEPSSTGGSSEPLTTETSEALPPNNSGEKLSEGTAPLTSETPVSSSVNEKSAPVLATESPSVPPSHNSGEKISEGEPSASITSEKLAVPPTHEKPALPLAADIPSITSLKGTDEKVSADEPSPLPLPPVGETSTEVVIKEVEKSNKISDQDPFIQALSSAYVCNPQLHAAVRQQYALAESIPQALAGWRPNLAVQGQGQKTKTVTEGISETLGIVANQPIQFRKQGLDSTSNSSIALGSITLTQNIFQGGRTVYGVNQAENQVLAGEAGLINTEEQVLLAAIQAYLDLWKAIQFVEFRKASELFQKSTRDQTKAQVEAGEKTIVDEAQAESAYAQAMVDRINAEAQVLTARATYRQVIGAEPPETILSPKDFFALFDIPGSLEEAKKMAIDQNPGVLNAFYSEKAAADAISIAEGALLPTLDAQLNGQRTWRQDGNGKNVDKIHSRSNNGQALLTLNIPLYQSGAEWSKLRQANQQRYQSLASLKQQKLAAMQQAVAAWEAWKAAQESLSKLQISVNAAVLTVEGRRQQYFVGEATLTDLLGAESSLVQTQSNLVQAQRDYLVQGYTLIATYGCLIPATLRLPVCRYDVKNYTEQVRKQLIGTGNLRHNLQSY